jgi:hypothetical protein
VITSFDTAPDPIMTSISSRPEHRNLWLGMCMFIYGWFGIIGFMVHGSMWYLANICFSISMTVAFMRIPPPLGGLPLLRDLFLMQVHRWSVPYSFSCMMLGLYRSVLHDGKAAVLFVFASLFILKIKKAEALKEMQAILSQRKASRVGGLRQKRTGSGFEIPSLGASLSWLIDLHPALFMFVAFPASAVEHIRVGITSFDSSAAPVHMDIWRLRKSCFPAEQFPGEIQISPLQIQSR